MKISVYGAGNNAKTYLPKITGTFEIMYILDQAEKKQGTNIHNIKIVKPDRDIINKYPVFILIDDVRSAFDTLTKLGCTQKIYAILKFGAGFGFYLYNSDQLTSDLVSQGYWFQNSDRDFARVPECETSSEYVPGHIRCFNMASPDKFEDTGGPCACLRNLLLANEEFHLIDNFYTLCPVVAYIPKGAPHSEAEVSSSIGLNTKSLVPLLEEIRNLEDSEKVENLWLYSVCLPVVDFLRKADARFHFASDDVFLLQDPFIVEAFTRLFPDFNHVTAAYHMQGSLSSEFSKSHATLEEMFNKMQEDHLQWVRKWIFPSKGAADGFLETGTELMRKRAKECKFFVAYNGYEKKEEIRPDTDFADQLEQIKDYDVLFASATFLYVNKGVERIPKVLDEFKKLTGLKIHWVLVGSGEMEDEVETNMQRYLAENEYTWYRRRFDNQDNIFALFKKADFYTMMHRVSVFDLSTLQAMSYGCVPLLSDVGGNKELCGFQNGILVDPDRPHMDLTKYMYESKWQDQYLEQQKKLNSSVVREQFNNKKFLEGYRNVLYQMRQESNSIG